MTRRLALCVLALGIAACSDSPTGPVSPPRQTPPPPITVPPTVATPPVPTTEAPAPQPTPDPRPPATTPPAHESCASDNENPRVFISAPNNGATVRTRTIPFSADVDDRSPITKVEFYYHWDVRGTAAPVAAGVMDPITFITRKNNPPYTIQWDVPRTCNSVLSLYAWAYDACGNVGEADLIRVSVCN